jgi:hypothetical protein
MLGSSMPQGMRAATAANDADACEAIVDDFAESLSADRSDGRSRCEEEASSVTGRTGLCDVAQNGMADGR